MNNYPRAIEIISSLDELDEARTLLLKIAGKRPSAIVRAFDGPRLIEQKATENEAEKKLDDLKERCRMLLADGRKIDAVKLWRNEAGVSLIDAKNAVEDLHLIGH